MRILVAEDDPAVATLLLKALTEEGYEVTIAPDGTTGWDYLQRFTYDAVLLDVMLPGINGLEICRRCREAANQVPIIMLTALGTTDNIVLGLDNGANDYLTKPFKIAELLARIRSLIRRPAGNNIPTEQPDISNTVTSTLSCFGLTMNQDEKTVWRNGVKIDLTATEFRLLEYLMQNAKRVLSRMDILEKVWGYDFELNTKVVDVYINYLRKKIDHPFQSRLIHTVVGMGYVLKEE